MKDKSIKIDSVHGVWELNHFPLVLHPDSFVSYKQVIIKWKPGCAMLSEVDHEVLFAELVEELRKVLIP